MKRQTLAQTIALTGVLLASAGCIQAERFVSRTVSSGYTPGWYGPNPVDRMALYDSDLSTAIAPDGSLMFKGTESLGTFVGGGPCDGAPTEPGCGLSFLKFQLEASSDKAVFVGSFWEAENGAPGDGVFRSMGRTYTPYSLGGTGWAAAGPDFGYLDAAAAADTAYRYTGVVGGWLATGDFLAAISTGSSSAAPGSLSAVHVPDEGWSFLGNSVTQNTTSEGVAVPLSVSTTSAVSLPSNGEIMSIGTDKNGTGYLAYVHSSSTANFPSEGTYIQRYIPHLGWDQDTSGIRVGDKSEQLQVVSDGMGATAFWNGPRLEVAVGLGITCKLIYDGTVQCVGEDSEGALGDNDSSTTPANYKESFVNVTSIGGSGKLKNATQIAVGYSHACALIADGTVNCWGYNGQGQLGDGTTTDRPSPRPVLNTTGTGYLANVTAISAAGPFTCALLTNGTVACWGDNDTNGSIGQNSVVAASYYKTPQLVRDTTGVAGTTLGSTDPIIQIAAGLSHACALGRSGNIYCWGLGTSGQLGDTFTNTTPYPVTVSGINNATHIAAGGLHSCAALSTGAARCWGDQSEGQLGNNVIGAGTGTPQTVEDSGGVALTNVRSVATGRKHSCALFLNGSIKCWGDNTNGQIGVGSLATTEYDQAQAVNDFTNTPSITSGVAKLIAAEDNTCIITTAGVLGCWGDNSYYQLATNSITERSYPLQLTSQSGNYLQTAWSASSGFRSVQTLSTGDTKTFSAAADGKGNVLAVFIQKHPLLESTNCDGFTTPATIEGCEYRLYASVRNSLGIWSGPMQIDSSFTPTTTVKTTLFQDSNADVGTSIVGGKEYFTPGVAYVGDGKFLVSFAMIDNGNETTGLYVIPYTFGSGWGSITTLDSYELSSTGDAFRLANDLHFTGTGQGEALLTVQNVIEATDMSDGTLRHYGFRAYQYSESSGWATPLYIQNQYTCVAPTDLTSIPDTYPCWNLKFQGAIFPGGETVVVFPAPDPADADSTTGTRSLHLRLYSLEYRP